jgi:hypothetical protein
VVGRRVEEKKQGGDRGPGGLLHEQPAGLSAVSDERLQGASAAVLGFGLLCSWGRVLRCISPKRPSSSTRAHLLRPQGLRAAVTLLK